MYSNVLKILSTRCIWQQKLSFSIPLVITAEKGGNIYSQKTINLFGKSYAGINYKAGPASRTCSALMWDKKSYVGQKIFCGTKKSYVGQKKRKEPGKKASALGPTWTRTKLQIIFFSFTKKTARYKSLRPNVEIRFIPP
jgi:hypothetical protein